MKWRLDHGQIEVMDKSMAEVFRQKTTAEKAAMIFAAHRTARLLVAAGVRDLHPELNETEIQVEVSRRLLNGTG